MRSWFNVSGITWPENRILENIYDWGKIISRGTEDLENSMREQTKLFTS